ncbi:hypothetical protein AB97_0488 [Escherichia coli 1-110-08_S3_C1]|nr:hypothetical protein AC55_0630 [Escherichia coli 1-110-08_S3_C3]EYE29704.1 hypothetical protein AC25_0197 [Escherichia coli 1-110-08_S3_C2]EYE30359.1 hypothetical protein AB97_0488 [Escherichia coli 1-110-08_S3_C1]
MFNHDSHASAGSVRGPAFFSPRAVYWLCLLMILFMHHSGRGDIDKHHHLRANSYTE